MHRLARLCLAFVLSVCLGLGSLVHASEGTEGADAAAECTADHFENDGDRLVQDAAKASPHHHAECHGHHVGVLATASSVLAPGARRLPLLRWQSPRHRPSASGPEPRPPRA